MCVCVWEKRGRGKDGEKKRGKEQELAEYIRGIGTLRAELTGSCVLYNVGAGSELQFSIRVVHS